MASTDKRRAQLLTGLGLTVLLSALLVLILSSGQSSVASGDDTPSSDAPGEIVSQFAVLTQESPGEIESLSQPVKQVLSQAGRIEALGKTTTVNRDPVTVVLAGGSICVFNESPARGGGGCGSPEEALQGQLVSAGFCQPGVPEGSARLFGLVPDGVTSIAVGGVAERLIAVESNVYEGVVPAVPTTIVAIGPNGGAEVSMPLDEFAKASGPCAKR